MDKKAEIVALYKAGKTAPEIARTVDCGESNVYRVLSRAGIPRRTSGRRRFTPEVEAEMVRDYQNGKTYETIAAERGCSIWVIGRLLRANGVTPRPMGGRKSGFAWDKANEIIQSYRAGLSQKKIADQLGVSQAVVSRILRRNGEPAIPRSRPYLFKGGRCVTGHGYVQVRVSRDDPFAAMQNASGYVLEHRLVMARFLNRSLARTETVHHRNGDRADNRIENLQLFVGKHGSGASHAHCATCTCFHGANG
jgi:uncharacterized protein YerC